MRKTIATTCSTHKDAYAINRTDRKLDDWLNKRGGTCGSGSLSVISIVIGWKASARDHEICPYVILGIAREKERDLTRSYDKSSFH